MSDLGEIFHVKKDGVQYDAHAYTTLDECPEPNLKLTYKGQQAYVKLEAKGDGDVPCYVKTKAGNTYQVKKEAVPTGTQIIKGGIDFTVPPGIKVIEVCTPVKEGYGHLYKYIGVTPNSVHKLRWRLVESESSSSYRLYCASRHKNEWGVNYIEDDRARLSWSPEINKHTPTVTDY